MAHPTYKDAGNAARSRKGTGAAGTNGDPDIFIDNIESIASGASPDIGAVADAAIVTDTTGSLSGKMRGLVKWAFERMPASLGQKTIANSLSVTLASSHDPIQLNAGTASIGGVKLNGVQYTVIQKPFTDTDATTGTEVDVTNTLVDPAKGIALDYIQISVGTDMELTLIEVGGTVVAYMGFFKAAAQPVEFRNLNSWRGSANKKLQLLASVSGNVRGFASWHEDTPL